MSTLLDAVLQYLKSGPTDYAMMITGPWGSGKSYFWKKTVVPAIENAKDWLGAKPSLLYVSLYGLADWATVEASVLWQLHPKLQTLGRVGSVIGRAAFQYFGQDRLGEAISLTALIDKLPKQDQIIICFDDLERSAMPVATVMGHINQFVEHLEAKVLILCNEEEIIKRDSESEESVGGQEYQRTKEKVVRITRVFDVDHAPIIDQIINESYRDPYRQFLKEQTPEVNKLFVASQLKNLRILKYGLDVVGIAFAQFLRVAPDDSDRRAKLIQTLLPVIFEMQGGRMSKGAAAQLLRDRQTLVMAAFGQIDDSKAKDPLCSFISQYKLNVLNGDMLVSEAIAELVTTGYLDEAKLRHEIETENVEQSTSQSAVKRFTQNWYKLDDDLFQKSLHDALEAIRSGEISDWNILGHTINVIESAVNLGMTELSQEEIRRKFEEGLDVLQRTHRFDLKAVRFAAHELMGCGGDDQPRKWLRDRLISINKQLQEAALLQKARTAFDAIQDDASHFSYMMSECGEEGFGDRPIAPFVSPDEFVEKFLCVPNAAKHELGGGIQRRYHHSPCIAKVASDIEWLSAVKSRLDDWLKTMNGKRVPSVILVTRLREQVSLATEWLRSEQSPASQEQQVCTASAVQQMQVDANDE